jgi:catechol 2,3-dioxygenase-like lactoylglutathione lyase family enzyme
MTMPKIKRLAHLVLYVSDPEVSAAWYCDVLGMSITARVGGGPYVGGVFLSFGESDHDLALFPGDSAAPRGREFEHFGLELEGPGDLEPLRRVYGRLLQKKARIQEVLDHGVSVGVYFLDPDGHMLEVFTQLVPTAEGASRAELGRNQGKADPIELTPLYE